MADADGPHARHARKHHHGKHEGWHHHPWRKARDDARLPGMPKEPTLRSGTRHQRRYQKKLWRH